MVLDPGWATASSEHTGDTHRFCSRGCKAVFDENPAGLLRSEETNTLADGRCEKQRLGTARGTISATSLLRAEDFRAHFCTSCLPESRTCTFRLSEPRCCYLQRGSVG